MRKRATGILLFCVFLLAAIVAGYLDMLNSERERLAQLGSLATAPAAPSSPHASPDPATAQPPSATAPAEARLPLEAPVGGAAQGSAQPAAPAGADGADGASEAADAANAPPAAAAAAAVDVPSFDVLRAEPNGDLVVAGRAPAGATVALTGNGREIARETASEAGAFAMVLSEPLTPGAHQLALSATLPDGRQEASRQTALVDVPPEGEADRLLAMIEEPDAPSRLVEVPKAAEPEAGAVQPPTAPAGSAASGTAGPAPVAEPELGRAAAEVRPDAPADGARSAAADGATPPPAAGEPPAAVAGERDKAPAGGEASRDAPRPDVAPASPLVVEAVEIENGRVFVAGTAARGMRVRVYLDNALVGEAPVAADGRFLVTATRDVPVGGHSVRADQVAADGSVAFRAEVPFARPDDGAMSAVASNGQPEAPERAAAGDVPSAGARVEPPTDVAALAASQRRDAPDGEAVGTDAADEPIRSPAAAPDADAPAAGARPTEAPADGAGAASAPQAPAPAAIAAAPSAGGTPPAAAASGAAPAVPEADARDADVATVVQAPLTTVEGRVIIRRGDSLWRISRELYGAGRRYTVIYLANGDQIRDPNRIYPGQVFRVPDEAEGDAPAENEG